MLYKTRCVIDISYDRGERPPMMGWRADLMSRLNRVYEGWGRHFTRFCHMPVYGEIPSEVSDLFPNNVLQVRKAGSHITAVLELDKAALDQFQYGVSFRKIIERASKAPAKEFCIEWLEGHSVGWVDDRLIPYVGPDIYGVHPNNKSIKIYPHNDISKLARVDHPLNPTVDTWPAWVWDLMEGKLFTLSGIGLDVYEPFVHMKPSVTPKIKSPDIQDRFISSVRAFINPGLPTVWFTNEAEAVELTIMLEDRFKNLL